MPLNNSSLAIPSSLRLARPVVGACTILLAMVANPTWAQKLTVTPAQRAIASQVAQSGVPLSDLAPNAPDSHTVKRGDTLWDISGIFLKRPWRWPELWGMNQEEIKNPHRIYPGQVLYLDKTGDRARLSTRRPGEGNLPTVRVSPGIRIESLSQSAIPPVNMEAIESFLTEPLIVDEATLARAPRIVATPENRVLLSLGDRAYARGQYGDIDDLTQQALTLEPGKPRKFRVFRNAVALKDPVSGEVLAYEAQYVGKARLVRSEGRREAEALPGKSSGTPELVPATIDIVGAKEEMRVGDRLLPEPEREFPNYVPRAPGSAQNGTVISVYGNAVRYAAQNQVVAINRGKVNGLEEGHVLALVRDSSTLTDKTDDSRPRLRLPGEFNGLMMVFRTFDKVSYALVLEIQDGVKVGDRFSNP